MTELSSSDTCNIGYYPGEDARNNIISYLDAHAANMPDHPALRWVDTRELAAWDGNLETPLPYHEVSYGSFVQGIKAVAGGLATLGIRKGDRVVIFLPMGVAMYTAMFAVQHLGAVAVFLDSWARREHLGVSAACVEPVAMISHHAAFELINTIPEFAHMPTRIIAGPGEYPSYTARLENLFALDSSTPLVPMASDSSALITFTTGSSGIPKGANRTHRFLSAQHIALAQILPYTTNDSDLPAFPIFSLNNLASGVTTIIPALDLAKPSPRDGMILIAQICQQQITCTTLSPSMLRTVSASCRENSITLPSLRRVITGGAPISRDDVSGFRAIAPNARILVLYGSTEVEPMAHIDDQEMLAQQGPADPEIVEYGVNVGHIDANLAYKFIKIVDGVIDLRHTSWSELEVPPHAVGEFIVSGEHVCRDYFNNAAAFLRTKIVESDGRVWHRTGDLARLDEHNNIWVVGRTSNVINRGETYLFPVQAENILQRVQGVLHGAFLGLPDDDLKERAAAVVELAVAANPQVVLQEAQRLFAKHGIPLDAFYVVTQIPMDSRHHSKVEYGALRSQLNETEVKDYLHDC